MIYREFGKTGEKLSALGYGCMRLPEILKADGSYDMDYQKSDELIKRAYELGVNYFDTGSTYSHGNNELAVGHAVKEFRDQIYLSTKCPLEFVHSKEDYHRLFDESRKKLGSDTIDFYHFWALNRDRFDHVVMKLGLIDEALKLKSQGKIRHISFSFHDDPEVIKYIIDTAPELETMLAQYNLLDRSNEKMFAYAASKGLGTLAMGPVGGGRLAAPASVYQKLTGKKSIATYELALRFVLGNPNIHVALSGMTTLEMVNQNAAVASLEEPMTQSEWEELSEALENVKKFSELYCTGCNYCQPCPKGIEISRIFQAYTYHNVYGLSELAKNEYSSYLSQGGKTAQDCINCGYCERKCPQKLKIRAEMKRVEEVLGGI